MMNSILSMHDVSEWNKLFILSLHICVWQVSGTATKAQRTMSIVFREIKDVKLSQWMISEHGAKTNLLDNSSQNMEQYM